LDLQNEINKHRPDVRAPIPMIIDAHAHPLPLNSLYRVRLTAVIAAIATIKAKRAFRAGVMVGTLASSPFLPRTAGEMRRAPVLPDRWQRLDGQA